MAKLKMRRKCIIHHCSIRTGYIITHILLILLLIYGGMSSDYRYNEQAEIALGHRCDVYNEMPSKCRCNVSHKISPQRRRILQHEISIECMYKMDYL